ncbi:MAG: BTAD domain-containing putative transcriptional regulator, partial [Acidimicrobiia bacterium]
RLTDPDLAPLPATVTNLRRAVRNAAGHPDEPADADDTNHHPLDAISDPGEAAEQPDADGTEPPEDPDRTPPRSLDGPPGHPDGLGLVGPGADAAARGFLAAALTAGGVDDPHARAQVVIPAATLATLLGADAVTLPDTPRLTVTPGLPEALDTLDHATLHRTRLAYEHETTTVAEIRHDDPTEEPLPPLLLIADTDADAAHQRARIAALLTQGRRLDLHAVLLGDWPTGHTLHVNTDGTTNPTHRAPHADQQPAVNGRLAVLTPAETADLLTVLAESHTGHPPTPPPAEHAPSRPAHPEQDATPDEPRPVEGAADPVATIEGDDRENLTDDQQAPAQPSPTATQTAETQLDAGPALVSVLGAPRIHYNRPPPKEPFRGKARELLVYLAVNDGGATSNAILEDVYGDVPHSRAAHRLHVCVSNL